MRVYWAYEEQFLPDYLGQFWPWWEPTSAWPWLHWGLGFLQSVCGAFMTRPREQGERAFASRLCKNVAGCPDSQVAQTTRLPYPEADHN